jgi:glycosyltransferase involved in cell wall biosynthesis
VTWLDRWVSHEEKLSLLARCLATVFTPLDEDYGYVTIESFSSGKPVITCSDSGGPLEFVVAGETGLVSEPDPRGLAAAIDELAGDRDRARAMGETAARRLEELDITWPHVVDTLLAA